MLGHLGSWDQAEVILADLRAPSTIRTATFGAGALEEGAAGAFALALARLASGNLERCSVPLARITSVNFAGAGSEFPESN